MIYCTMPRYKLSRDLYKGICHVLREQKENQRRDHGVYMYYVYIQNIYIVLFYFFFLMTLSLAYFIT